jgi:enoyl-CoA hydratase/carnithine racemase
VPDEPPLVTTDRRDDGVAVVRLDNGKVNALSTGLLRQLQAAAESLTADPPGAVVVTGSTRMFAAGAEISEFGGPDEARAIGGCFVQALDALTSIPRPTIAAINGFALGGGCELALACDLRVCAASARLGQPEILLGIIPGGGGTQRLARLVGPSRAKDIIFSGRQVGAEEALRIGLVDRIGGDDALDDALAWAGELAKGAVVAMGLAKRAIDDGLDLSLDAGLELEQQLFAEVFGTEDATSGVASFLEQGPGKAEFKGR